MNYASPERQRIARLNALGVKADKFILDNGIQLPARPVQFNHDQPIEVMSGPPPGHPAALPYFDDGYTGGVPDDGYGQQVVVSEPPAEPKVHPLAKFIDYETTGRIEPVIYVIDEVLEQAITLIAGAAGAGKTTQLVPVFARCTHLVNDTELLPLLRRKVIYVAEDPRQVIRIVTSMRLSGAITCPDEDFHHWFRIVKAKRLEPVEIVKVVAEYAGLFTTNVGSDGVTRYEAPPVVVFDTAAATFRLENENDNAQVSACISALKDHFGNIPVVIVAHTAKALKRSDIKEFSARGAGAWEADAQQVLYLTKEDQGEERFLAVQGAKHRFVTNVEGMVFTAVVQTLDSHDILGNPTRDTVIHTIPRILRADDRAQLQAERMQVKEAEQELSRKAKQAELRQEILDKAQIAWQSGAPVNRSGLRAKVKGSNGTTSATVDCLLTEGWLYEVTVPKDMRTNSNRSTFLINLSAAERHEYIKDGKLPAAKMVIPPSWKKQDAEASMATTDSVGTVCPGLSPSVPAVPEPTGTNGTDGGVEYPIRLSPCNLYIGDERIGRTNGIDSQAANLAQPAKNKPTKPSEEF